jgi:hypothetical protein
VKATFKTKRFTTPFPDKALKAALDKLFKADFTTKSRHTGRNRRGGGDLSISNSSLIRFQTCCGGACVPTQACKVSCTKRSNSSL